KIVKREQFIQDEEIQPYFQLADVILAPYQRHIGMSAILVRAAAAQKLVLSCNYGLMGEMVKRYELGTTVDASSPGEIAKGITQFLQQPEEKIGNLSSIKSFAQINTAENFAKTIFNNL
ncbi:MAG: glycosyltransferase, partial [Spirulinaceae cyanobacterium]